MPEVNATCLDSQRLSALGSFVRPSECARQVMRLVVPQCNMLQDALGGRLSILVKIGNVAPISLSNSRDF